MIRQNNAVAYRGIQDSANRYARAYQLVIKTADDRSHILVTLVPDPCVL